MLCFDIVNLVPPCRYFLVYRPPYSDECAVQYMRSLVECLELLTVSKHINVIVGDFNLPKINWATFSCPDDFIHKPFLDFTVDNGFSQFVQFVDLVLSDCDRYICHLAEKPPFGNSDHCMLHFCAAHTHKYTGISEHERLQSSHGNKHYDWNRADYDYFEYCLQSVDWQSLLCNHPCTTESYSAFISTLRCFIDECVPHKERVCVRGKRKCKPRKVRRCDLKQEVKVI